MGLLYDVTYEGPHGERRVDLDSAIPYSYLERIASRQRRGDTDVAYASCINGPTQALLIRGGVISERRADGADED